MGITERIGAVRVLLALAVGLALQPDPAAARIEIGDLEISGQLFNYTEYRLGGERGPETMRLFVAPGTALSPADLGTPSHGNKYSTISAMRTELLMEIVYSGIPHFTPVLKLRPYYDAMFDINSKSSDIARFWETNVRDGLNDNWDPLVREAFVDVNFHPLFIRAGRQIVTWGRSDGVVVLDVVTPRNFRNPLTFEQERFMIPQWMVNTKLDLSSHDWIPGGIQKELQILWNIEYLPARFPGFQAQEEGRHPWTLNVVDFANQVIRVSETLYGESNFFDDDAWSKGSIADRSELFARWRGRTGSGLGPISDMTYSFHYGYLYEDVPFYELGDRVDAGFAIDIAAPRAAGGGIDFGRHRYQLAGFSFDKALMALPGQLEGLVLRGEFAYGFGKQFYEPDFGLVESNTMTFLVGLDQYLYLTPRSWIKTPWFVSLQYWHDRILREPGPGEFTNLGSVPCQATPDCGDTGYLIGGGTSLFNGLRDQSRNVVTLFMFNDFLPGKTLHVEFFGLHEFGSRQRASWLRGVVGYNFNSHLSARLGINAVWGERTAFFGQFEKNDSIFTELKYTF